MPLFLSIPRKSEHSRAIIPLSILQHVYTNEPISKFGNTLLTYPPLYMEAFWNFFNNQANSRLAERRQFLRNNGRHNYRRPLKPPTHIMVQMGSKGTPHYAERCKILSMKIFRHGWLMCHG